MTLTLMFSKLDVNAFLVSLFDKPATGSVNNGTSIKAIQFQNGCNKVAIELWVVQFWPEIRRIRQRIQLFSRAFRRKHPRYKFGFIFFCVQSQKAGQLQSCVKFKWMRRMNPRVHGRISNTQANELVFGQSPGQQCVSMSLCPLIYNNKQGINSANHLVSIMNIANQLYSSLFQLTRQ